MLTRTVFARRALCRTAQISRLRHFTVSPFVFVSEEFNKAKEAVTRVPQVSNQEKLRLYALYKQATEGPNTQPEPGMFNVVAKYKHQAWAELGSMSQEEAEQQYIELCKGLGADVDGSGSPAPAAAAPAPSGQFETLLTSVEKGVYTVQLNRPDKRNAFSMKMYEEIGEALTECAARDDARVLMLTGKGSYYSSGNDLTNFTENMPPEGPEKFAEIASDMLQRFIDGFIDFPKPVVVAMNGPAVGIPVTLLGLCDLAYASHRATLETPFTRLGLAPEACSSYMFPSIMGRLRASDLLLMGRKLTAEEARHWGLINEVFEDGSFMEQATARAQTLAALPPTSVRDSKFSIRERERETLKKVNEEECRVLRGRWLSSEVMDAVSQFLSRKG